jgi:hypothetical protein
MDATEKGATCDICMGPLDEFVYPACTRPEPPEGVRVNQEHYVHTMCGDCRDSEDRNWIGKGGACAACLTSTRARDIRKVGVAITNPSKIQKFSQMLQGFAAAKDAVKEVNDQADFERRQEGERRRHEAVEDLNRRREQAKLDQEAAEKAAAEAAQKQAAAEAAAKKAAEAQAQAEAEAEQTRRAAAQEAKRLSDEAAIEKEKAAAVQARIEKEKAEADELAQAEMRKANKIREELEAQRRSCEVLQQRATEAEKRAKPKRIRTEETIERQKETRAANKKRKEESEMRARAEAEAKDRKLEQMSFELTVAARKVARMDAELKKALSSDDYDNFLFHLDEEVVEMETEFGSDTFEVTELVD